jgi:hypothetical protein
LAKDGSVAEINLKKTHEDDLQKMGEKSGEYSTVYTWHSHPKRRTFKKDKNGKYSIEVKEEIGTGSSYSSEDKLNIGGPGPSETDLDNAQTNGNQDNFIFYKKSKTDIGTVTHYNNKRKTTAMSMELFYKRAKSPPTTTDEKP